jgi:hypothetical protein
MTSPKALSPAEFDTFVMSAVIDPITRLAIGATAVLTHDLLRVGVDEIGVAEEVSGAVPGP